MLGNRVIAITVLCWTVVWIVGCGPTGPERVVVSGVVTYNGKPIPEGRINFIPKENTAAPMSGAAIQDGQYCVEARGGVPVGTYQIQVEAFKSNAASAEKVFAPGARLQYLPRKFNVDSQLEITIESGSKKVDRDIDLVD